MEAWVVEGFGSFGGVDEGLVGEGEEGFDGVLEGVEDLAPGQA